MLKQITSLQNPAIKTVLLLQEKSKARKQSGTFIIEGKREIELALKGNYQLEKIYFLPEFLTQTDIEQWRKLGIELIEITKDIYQRIAYRDTTEGIIAVAKTKNVLLSDLKLSKNPLILVLEGIEKPGNIGAILRTANAANLDAVLLADPKTDLYNPNLVRSSVGCIFTNQIATGSSEEIIGFLKQKGIKILATTLQNSTPYYSQDYAQPTAIVVGTEATGLSNLWRDDAIQSIVIPMQGEIDSMNVSVAAAVVVFEAKRQRNFE